MPKFDLDNKQQGEDELDNLLKDYKKIDEELIDDLGQLGLTVDPTTPHFDKEVIKLVDLTPEGEPILPSDLTKLGHKQIGEVASIFHHYLVFMVSQQALAEVRLLQWTEIRDLLWSALRIQLSGRKNDKDDEVKLDIRYIKINANYLKQQSICTFLNSKISIFNKHTRVISRELTRRGMEFEGQRSSDRSKPSPSSYF